jgi:hypothetical protein
VIAEERISAHIPPYAVCALLPARRALAPRVVRELVAAQPRQSDEIDLLVEGKLRRLRSQLFERGIVRMILERGDIAVVGGI